MIRLLMLLLPFTAWSADLLLNGDFERAAPGDPGRPLGWERPDGLGVRWLDAPGGGGHGKALRLDTRLSERELVASWRRAGITDWDIPNPSTGPVSDSYGISFYSDPVPVVRGQAYRVALDWLGPPGGIKVWVRGYARVAEPAAAATTAATAPRMRRIFEAVLGGESVVSHADAGGWRHAEHCFHPTRVTPAVAELRVMLYAYHPPQEYWFDNLRLEAIPDAVYQDYRQHQGK